MAPTPSLVPPQWNPRSPAPPVRGFFILSLSIPVFPFFRLSMSPVFWLTIRAGVT
jgi:hypothetical protein